MNKNEEYSEFYISTHKFIYKRNEPFINYGKMQMKYFLFALTPLKFFFFSLSFFRYNIGKKDPTDRRLRKSYVPRFKNKKEEEE